MTRGGPRKLPDGLIPWVDAVCRTYGYQMRRVITSDGYAPSVAGRVMDHEAPGTGHNQRFDEVLTGDALTVARAKLVLAEWQRMYVDVHYVVPGAAIAKAQKLKVSRSAYYDRLASTHKALSRAITAIEKIARSD